MQMNNRQLYEKIMRNVSKVLKNALNESFDSDFDEELNSYINKLRALPLSLADFYDVGGTDEIDPEIAEVLDRYGDYIENIIFCIYDEKHMWKDSNYNFTLEEIHKILKDEEFANGTEYGTVLTALDEIYNIVKNWDHKFRM